MVKVIVKVLQCLLNYCLMELQMHVHLKNNCCNIFMNKLYAFQWIYLCVVSPFLFLFLLVHMYSVIYSFVKIIYQSINLLKTEEIT